MSAWPKNQTKAKRKSSPAMRLPQPKLARKRVEIPVVSVKQFPSRQIPLLSRCGSSSSGEWLCSTVRPSCSTINEPISHIAIAKEEQIEPQVSDSPDVIEFPSCGDENEMSIFSAADMALSPMIIQMAQKKDVPVAVTPVSSRSDEKVLPRRLSSGSRSSLSPLHRRPLGVSPLGNRQSPFDAFVDFHAKRIRSNSTPTLPRSLSLTENVARTSSSSGGCTGKWNFRSSSLTMSSARTAGSMSNVADADCERKSLDATNQRALINRVDKWSWPTSMVVPERSRPSTDLVDKPSCTPKTSRLKTLNIRKEEFTIESGGEESPAEIERELFAIDGSESFDDDNHEQEHGDREEAIVDWQRYPEEPPPPRAQQPAYVKKRSGLAGVLQKRLQMHASEQRMVLADKLEPTETFEVKTTSSLWGIRIWQLATNETVMMSAKDVPSGRKKASTCTLTMDRESIVVPPLGSLLLSPLFGRIRLD